MKIIIDHRERKSNIGIELAKLGHDIEYKQLNVADFLLKTKTNEGYVIDVGIEKKTINDFLNSIIDKRILSQLLLLKENFNTPLLLIEGSENIYALRNFHPNSIRGMLASIAIDYKIPVIYTKNLKDTASFISVIAKRLEKSKKHFGLLSKKKPLTIKEQQEFIIESLPGIGPGLSKSLLSEFRTVKKIINASEKRLRKVSKIGPKKARTIKQIVDSYYDN